LTVLKTRQDGWVRNTGSGPDYGDKDATAYRAAVRWNASDSFVVDYAFDHTKEDGTSSYQQHQYDLGIFPFQFPLFPQRQDTTWRDVNLPLKDDYTTSGHTLTANWTLAPQVSLKSITAYRDLHAQLLHDGAESYDLSNLIADTTRQHQFSQEFLLTGATAGHQLTYHLGALYFTESGFQELFALTSAFGLSGAVPYVPPTIANLNAPVTGDVQNKSHGIYGQVTWTPAALDGRLSIDAGGRYSWDSRSLVAHHPENAPPVPVDSQGHVTSSSVDPSLTLDYRWVPAIHTYAKVAKAYRAGGFDETNPLATSFEPEHLTSYEVGVKSMLWNDRLRLNVDAFWEKYTDIQLNYTDPNLNGLNVRRTVNAGHATIDGVDAEIALTPVNGLVLKANATHLKSNSTQTNPFNGVSVTGQLPNIPKWKYDVSAEYALAQFTFGTLSAWAAYDFHDEQIAPGAATPNDFTPAYKLIDARLTLSEIAVGTRSHLDFSLWGKNLADQQYQVYHNFNSVIFGQPRTYGASATFIY
jgi:iron complex outermembrane recepter protein